MPVGFKGSTIVYNGSEIKKQVYILLLLFMCIDHTKMKIGTFKL
jgi:hypothetical protein